jgi:hypothetical protein
MSITVSLAVLIFLLGAAVGALRLQWIAFKQKVSQEMMEQLGAEPPAESATRFCHPNVAKFIAPYADDSRAGLKKLLEENQMEIARILREVPALWSAMGSFGNAPDMTEQYAYGDGTSDSRSLQMKYARWFSPNRALTPD